MTALTGLLVLACIALTAALYQRTSERNLAYASLSDLQRAAALARQDADTLRAADAARVAAESDDAQRRADLAHYADFVSDVVRTACRDVGLNDAQFGPTLDLVPTGKLADVLYHTAQRLVTQQPVRTVSDVIRLFVGAEWAS
ncbi:MAG TPA: hypothetical protein VEA69_01395 [Tepidisphaeraceae bacterium]|nr:hypothetical protein [Tepidisphaeraceae bacterium]